jgi:hypothetical protein
LDVAVIAAWLATGAHTGWTKTSVTTMRTDPVTELQYPETRRQLVIGIDILIAGLVLSGSLVASGALLKNQNRT